MDLGILDILFLAIIIISSLRGAFRGMVQELISLAALLISLLLAAVFYPDGTDWIQARSSLGESATLISFVCIFAAAFILFMLLKKAIVFLINETPFESVDKLLGFFLGILEGLLICFLIVYLIDFQEIIDLGNWTVSSKLLPYIERFLPALDKPAEHILEKLSSGSL
ncbi:MULTISPECIES: CvpA family protein [unclassified Oceanispirochaeta]|uniref:CvpA family protein n=1 Tax=unclassified Oceanispirochaeta TaxID=2635722 RepID=UPI000E099D06|nr:MULTISPECIES: CvpA family protein [unclassified Oceanispirochaeta]MBF9017685.1 CvpA family protein [Oceanispirochaeta sp. M2]NPD74257.1 CvpA family protein [Oceanispirochaeta sp. M1]RDG29963.1 CvpA family protein [Oceanispirochaeta sp. M1]